MQLRKYLSSMKWLVLFLLFSALFSFPVFAQVRLDKRTQELYDKAILTAEAGELDAAIAGLKEAVARQPQFVDAHLSLAGIWGQKKDATASVVSYEKAFSIDSTGTRPFLLPYSINLASLGRFAQATVAVEKLLATTTINAATRKAAEYRRKTYRFALDYAAANPAGDWVFRPENLGAGINSPESEYFPSLPIESNRMVFTRRRNSRNEDFFSSDKTGADWAKAEALAGGINTPDNEGAQTVSQDGGWLLFTGCNRPDGRGGCDLYLSYATPDGWSEALNLGATVNSESWDAQPALSPDKRTLYFTSNRPGGYGGNDLWYAEMGPNGRWGKPQNMGAGLNTTGDEESPFMHADGETLYFSSTGLPGYGDKDLFYTKKTATATIHTWSTPKNLGYPINTIYHDGTIAVAADGRTAYYASDRSGGLGGLDIYRFDLRPDLRPARTLWVRGSVRDKESSRALPSTVELVALQTGGTLSRMQTDESGRYLVALPTGRDYAFEVMRKGYLFYSDQFLLRTNKGDSVYEKDILLQPVKAGAAVVLRNVFFDFSKSELKPESKGELDRLAGFLRDNPTVRLQIEGHTDNVGAPADNAKLSTARATAVVAYLVQNGVAANRLVPKGFGASKPAASNATEEGRAQNRRTEAKVL